MPDRKEPRVPASSESSKTSNERKRLWRALANMQLLMRQEMEPEEQAMWQGVLECYPIESIEQVLTEFAIDTPGDFLPKLKDVKARLEAVTKAGQPSKLQREMADLRRRAASGEKFYGIADLMKDAKDKFRFPD